MNKDKVVKELLTVAKELTAGVARDAIFDNWNTLHDIEGNLEDAENQYNIAASYGADGHREAQAIAKLIRQTKKELEKISTKLFGRLVDAEKKFENRHGDVEKYIVDARDEMFSN